MNLSQPTTFRAPLRYGLIIHLPSMLTSRGACVDVTDSHPNKFICLIQTSNFGAHVIHQAQFPLSILKSYIVSVTHGL